MRITQILNAQHIGHMFKKHWVVANKRKIPNTGVSDYLNRRGIQVIDSKDLIKPKFTKSKILNDNATEVTSSTNVKIPRIECHTFDDSNVLLQGIPQACILTKTIEIDRLPKNIEDTKNNMKISDQTDFYLQNSIFSSVLFDAEQKKTKSVKDPERPAWVYPRNFGITDKRKNELLIARLLFGCEKLAEKSITTGRKVINDVNFILPLQKDEDHIQMDLIANTLIISKNVISPIEVSPSETEMQLPNLHPLKYTISMPIKYFKKLRYFHPILQTNNYPHTILIHFSDLDVKNLHGTDVTESQFQARSLLKAFTVAGSSARFKYGDDIKNLPEPIVVQSVQTDGKSFYFGVFQLNTLDLNGTNGLKNYWFHVPSMNLYSACMYKTGVPVLEDFNKDVFKYLYAFYNNS